MVIAVVFLVYLFFQIGLLLSGMQLTKKKKKIFDSITTAMASVKYSAVIYLP